MDSGRRGVQSRIACFPIGCSKTPETQKRLLPRKLMPVGNAPVCVETKDLPARQTGKSNMTSMRDLFRGRLHFSLRPSDSNRPLRCWLSARVLAEVVTSVQTNGGCQEIRFYTLAPVLDSPTVGGEIAVGRSHLLPSYR